MKKVCWISNAPAPYKVALMQLLGKQVELTCLFECRGEKDREKSWYDYRFSGFQAIFLSETDARAVIRHQAAECDCLINSDYTKPICMYAVRQFHRAHKPTILHADGGLAVPRGMMDQVISLVMKKNDYFMSSGSETDQYFRYYGIPKDHIFHYRFACMPAAQLEENRSMREHYERCRSQCGYQEAVIFLSVGQQIPRKGYDLLAKALEGTDPSKIGVYVIGGLPEDDVSCILQGKRISNMHFLPFMESRKLSAYYAGADVFVLPTRYDIWGLVINEAMSFGLPILSTTTCVAARQFSSLFQNAVLYDAENIAALHENLLKLAAEQEFRRHLGNRSATGIREYSLESMCADFVQTLQEVMERYHQPHEISDI